MSSSVARTLADGFAFLECPRWHEGRLWVPDMHRDLVVAIDDEGDVEQIAEVPGRPGGLGWLPDGSFLVVATLDRKIMRYDRGQLSTYCDLSTIGVTDHELNDMTVDATGRCFVGEFGVDIHAWMEQNVARAQAEGMDSLAMAPMPEASVFVITTDGVPTVGATGFRFPNGSAVDTGATRFVVAETFGLRLSEFDIVDGALSGRRVHDLGFAPDGISQMDSEGAVWVSNPLGRSAHRVSPDGTVTDEVGFDLPVYACELGGPDGRSLYACLASTADPYQTVQLRDSRIDVARVAVPSAAA